MPREVPDYSKMSVHKMSRAMEKVNFTAGQQLKETMAIVYEAMKKGATHKDIFDFKPETIEYFYAQAYTMYNQGKYNEALYMFQILLLMDPGQIRHALGTAACLHRMGKYEAAGQIYLVAAPLDPENPLPYFHAADCYIKLHVNMMAEFHLTRCLELCGTKEQFAMIKDRASVMLEAVKAELVREEKEGEEEEKQKEKERQEKAASENSAG